MKREDITDWLIHFTKDISSKNQTEIYIKDEDEEGEAYILDYSNQIPNGYTSLTAFECLKNIVTECGIRYNYSLRNGKTTLFGGSPVICFTEMPLKSFIEYAKVRNPSSNSTYGIAIRKKEMYKYGARPVIYGLSNDQDFRYITKNNFNRTLDPSILSLNEQYRLVTFDLSDKNIDWSHEREWRLKKPEIDSDYILAEHNSNHLEEVPALNVFSEESYCSEILLIVNNQNEADEIHDIVLAQLDSKGNEYGVSFDPKKISLLLLENISDTSPYPHRIEDLPPEAYYKVDFVSLTPQELSLLMETIEEAKTTVTKNASIKFHKTTSLTRLTSGNYIDGCGNSSIHCSNPRNKYLRKMIELGKARAYGDGYSLVFIGETDSIQGVSYHEFVAKEVCDYVNGKLGTSFFVKTYFD